MILTIILLVLGIISIIAGVLALIGAEFEDGTKLPRVLAVLIVVGIFLMALPFGYTSVGAGEVGVKFNHFGGGVQEEEFSEGFHFKAPWITVDNFNTKTQDYTMSKIIEEGEQLRDDRVRTITREGLYVDLDITVLYHVDPAEADNIRRLIGKEGEYQDVVVRPTIRTATREVLSNYDAMDMYGAKREAIKAEMLSILESQLAPRHIIVEKLLVRDIELPTELTKAIESKKTAEQHALEMEYVIQTESKEKERKIIEAEGIATANDIIAGSLTNEYLTWYWIDNLDSHSSVLYVPVGQAGMPMFKEIE